MNRAHQIYQLKLNFLNFFNYSYFIMDEKTKQIAIVDPSWELLKIESVINELNGNLTKILLTHSHFDHVNLVNALLNKYDVKVYMSSIEADFYNFKCRNLNYLEDYDSIKLGETEILCLITPGHTVGGACYLLSDSIFTGDTIFIEGCGMCDGLGGSPEMMFESIQKIKNTVNHNIKIFPGHCYGKNPGDSLQRILKENIYFQINDKEKFVKFRMRTGQKNLFEFH